MSSRTIQMKTTFTEGGVKQTVNGYPLTTPDRVLYEGGGSVESHINEIEDTVGLVNLTSISEWEPSTEYVLGKRVSYNNKMYECIFGHTSGETFDPTKWDTVKLGNISGKVTDDLYDEHNHETQYYTSYDYHRDIEVPIGGQSASYRNIRKTSTFTGWGGYVGRPKNIVSVTIPIRCRDTEHPLAKCKIIINRVPEDDEFYLDETVSSELNKIKPWTRPYNSNDTTNILYSEIQEFEEPITSLDKIDFTFTLSELFVNTNNDRIAITILFDNHVTMWDAMITHPNYKTINSIKTIFNDYPEVNVINWYTATGMVPMTRETMENTNNPSYVTSTSYVAEDSWNDKDYDLNRGTILFVGSVTSVNESYTTYDIDSTEGGKFYNLVEDVLEDKDYEPKLNFSYKVASENFEDKEFAYYQAGFADLTKETTFSTNYTWYNPDSTFTGVDWCLGATPEEITFEGVMLPIRARHTAGASYTPPDRDYLENVWVKLWSVDSVATASTVFGDLNPVELVTAQATNLHLNVLDEEEAMVTIKLNTPITVPAGTVLVFGYQADYWIFKAKHKSKNLATLTNDFEGVPGKYSGSYAWYEVRTNGQFTCAKGWTNDIGPAVALVNFENHSIPSGQFDQKIEDLVDEKVAPYDSRMSNVESLVKGVEVRVAKKYDLVVGDTFQLFHRGIIKCLGDTDKYGVFCKLSASSKGYDYPKYFEWTPTASDVGSYTLTVYVRTVDGIIIDQKATTLVVHPIPTYTEETHYDMLGFGDSLTSSGTWFGEGIRRLVGTATEGVSGPASLHIDNLSIDTYGRKSATVNTHPIKHEGYGGWTWNSFLLNASSATSTTAGIYTLFPSTSLIGINTEDFNHDNYQHSVWSDPAGKKWKLEDIELLAGGDGYRVKFDRGPGNTGEGQTITLPTALTHDTESSKQITPFTNVEWESGNPFFDTLTNQVSFTAHAHAHGKQKADVVACLLTWNGGGGQSDGSMNYQSKITAHMQKATELIRDIHRDFPNAKVICMGIQISSLTGGTGANYYASGSYSDMWGTAMYAFDYDKALEELVTNEEFGEYCYYGDTKGQFDTINMMPLTTKKINTRSNKTEDIGTNGVHPGIEGYYQIGDAFFRVLVGALLDIQQEQQ